MDNSLKTKLENFSNSSINSEAEEHFMNDQLKSYFHQKLKNSYAKELDEEYNISRTKQNDNDQGYRGYNWKLLIFVSSALILLSLLTMFFVNKLSQPEGLIYASNDIYYEMDFTTRGNNNDNTTVLSCKQAYESKDFQNVITAFNSINNKNKISNELIFIAAISNSNTGNYKASLTAFNKILGSPESLYSFHQEAKWFKALTLIKMGEKIEAINTLNSIQKSESYYIEAQELLKDMIE